MPPLPSPDAPKAEWRAWAQAVRAGLPDRSADVCAGLAAFARARGWRCLLAYRALPGEPDLTPLAGEFTLLTTRAWWRERRLSLHDWAHATEVSRFGALQPPAGAPEVPREAVDAALLPGLAFDTSGVRLGYGGGFYDRLLSGWAVPTVGVTPQALLVPALPSEAHDARVAFIATETGVRATH